MGGIYRRKGNPAKNKKTHRARKGKLYLRDTDQIHDDMQPENFDKAKNKEMDETLPGLGQFYCVPCARFFVDTRSLGVHEMSKKHKQALKRSKEIPYTHKEAEEAGK